MNIRELKLFRHLAGTLHFGRTSQACNITPSGLTRAMQRLENELGHELFHRDKRSVSLSPSGVVFREYAEEVINRWSELQNSLSRNDTLQGELSLYCSVTAILSILPAIFNRFRKEHPDVFLHLQTGDAAKALYKIYNGEADISVAALPDQQPEGLDFIELIKTPLIFIAPDNHPRTITYNGIDINWRRTPIIVPERGLGRDRVDRWFEKKSIEPNIYSQVAGNEAIIAMVGMGCGVGVVPKLVLDQSVLKEQVTILDVSPKLKPFSVGICTAQKNRRNPVIAAFWDIATREAYDVQSI
ncbi:HTH-type transcriptional activator IlvY [Desulfosediminicola flagellatus]|uniref:HTH-type transcriptional activator IlvY n=1 Tax=Desulfosediminicola flagellatus TaxID=2569541 RepID=UPI0010AD3AA5|nr:HTH-type transcriptional activator IlvY [Desulfosediminicola flagellatus]